jgi:hypothetical protein
VPSHSWPHNAGPLSERMQIATARHTEMAEQLAALWAVVSFAAQSMLKCLSTKAFLVDVVGEMLAEF